uniref:NADH-ubiquinone oxidoreductase chain 1 n=1 Tax=Plectus acuminatus TaxID=70689 RepID=A0A1U7AFR6_PLEAC|nr:NADH dehydrogenase subunit 1 [Plectus acuminatus]
MSILVSVVCILLSVAFVTLFERHVLGITQSRLGPNRVSVMGLVQPLLDGIKLLSKEGVMPSSGNILLYIGAPLISFIIMILEWFTLPPIYPFLSFQWSCLFFLSCVGLMVYATLVSGVASYSKYSSIGALRSSSQTVSYEVVFAILVISMIMLFMSYSFQNSMNILLLSGLFVMWFICLIAETNRAPFDFAEGESELVSGFNVEYSSSGFVMLFLAEYGSILMLSYLTSVLFFCASFFTGIIFFTVILIRSVYPRFRYDKLMGFVWFKLLPISVYFLVFLVFIS